MVLDCFVALNDEKLSKNERIIACLCIFLEEIQSVSDIMELPDLEIICDEMRYRLSSGIVGHMVVLFLAF